MKDQLVCPNCGKVVEKYRNPFPTVDIIIEVPPMLCRARGTGELVLSGSSGKGPVETGPAPEKTGGVEPCIVLIKRKNPPFGWALPGGFVDYGESLESAAEREAEEETSLKVELLYQLGAYSDPSRDPRHHTISVVFVARAEGVPRAGDDASEAGIFGRGSLPDLMAFDHRKILTDYFKRCYPES